MSSVLKELFNNFFPFKNYYYLNAEKLKKIRRALRPPEKTSLQIYLSTSESNRSNLQTATASLGTPLVLSSTFTKP